MVTDRVRNELGGLHFELAGHIKDPQVINTQEGRTLANIMVRLMEVLISGDAPKTEPVLRHHK